MFIFVLLLLTAGVTMITWMFCCHLRRGWKDHPWIWDEANDRALFFAILFGIMVAGDLLRLGLTEKGIHFAWTGLGFIVAPYIAYTIGRLLGIRDRARHGTRLS